MSTPAHSKTQSTPKHGLERFTKLGRQGESLAADDHDWIALADQETQLIWELKTGYSRWQSALQRFTNQPDVDHQGADCSDHIQQLNQQLYAGGNTWRLPTLSELEKLYQALDVSQEWGIRRENLWYWSSTRIATDGCRLDYDDTHPYGQSAEDKLKLQKLNPLDSRRWLLRFNGGFISSDFGDQHYAARAVRSLK